MLNEQISAFLGYHSMIQFLQIDSPATHGYSHHVKHKPDISMKEMVYNAPMNYKSYAWRKH